VIPTIIFDTSGINALENGGAASEPLMRRLQCGFKVILTFTSAEELIATPELEKKKLSSLVSSGYGDWGPSAYARRTKSCGS